MGQNAVPCAWQTHNRSTKEENQYKQEAAVIIALGGGFQFFNIAYCGGGYLQKWAIPIWEEVAKFCRERELCFKAKPFSNIAVMVPYDVTPKDSANLYATWNIPSLSSFYTWISASCDIQLSPNVVFESELDNTDISQYELIILPDSDKITETAKAALIDFSKNGGKIIADIDAVNHFTNVTSIDTSKRETALRYVSDKNALSAFETDIYKADFSVPYFGELYTENYFENDSIKEPSAYVTNVEKGKIYSLRFDFSQAYKSNKTSAIKNWLRQLIQDTGIQAHVKVNGSSYIEVITTRKNDDLLINLVNLTGDHSLSTVRSYNEIIPLHNISVEIDKHREVYLEPEHIKLDSDNTVVKELNIHSVIVVKDYFK